MKTAGLRRLSAVLAVSVCAAAAAAAGEFVSYPPLRPLPAASQRAMGAGPARFVDARKGNDRDSGTQDAPWRTLDHAVKQLAAGQTLYLRGGIYWESVAASPQGTAEAPITLRSFPGELAILDGGFREFFEDPANAWEPYAQGGEGEYRSAKSYPLPDAGGNFGDSMVPLRIYGSFVDLRSAAEYEPKGRPPEQGVYVGPGVKHDDDTGRIHIRLAHTNLPGLGEENYRGETDPRKVPLVIAGSPTALMLTGAKHLRVQDLVIRGAFNAVEISASEGIEFDGVTIYAVRYGMIVHDCAGLKVANCALRGFDAPWHPRESGTDVDCFCPLTLVVMESGSNFEFACNEFTDHHDCIHIGDVDALDFHHNLVDHFNDDGIDLTMKTLGRHHVYLNRIARCRTTISIHRGAAAEPDEALGVYFYRNIFDLRRGTYGAPPATAEAAKEEKAFNLQLNLISDHGSPIWPPIFFYQNTVLEKLPAYRSNYASGLGQALKQTRRRVFNNIFVHQNLFPLAKARRPQAPFVLPPKPAEVDFQADGNLFWGLDDGAAFQGDFFAKFRDSAAFEASRKAYEPGWTAHDLFADPKFDALSADWKVPTQLTLQADSPAVNAGVAIPKAWPDPLRGQGAGSPDLGALPLGAKPWKVGIEGRVSVCP